MSDEAMKQLKDRAAKLGVNDKIDELPPEVEKAIYQEQLNEIRVGIGRVRIAVRANLVTDNAQQLKPQMDRLESLLKLEEHYLTELKRFDAPAE